MLFWRRVFYLICRTIMNVILFDSNRENFFPLSYTRPISHFLVGIFTIKEKWEMYYSNVSVKTVDYLSEKYRCLLRKDNLWINSCILPNNDLVSEINSLRTGEMLRKGNTIIAVNNISLEDPNLDTIESNVVYNSIHHITDIFLINGEEIKNDFNTFSLRKMNDSQDLSTTNKHIGDYPIYIDKGAIVECSYLNSTDGPIYIGKNSEVMEGSMIRGPFSMANNSIVKMGSKIYGSTSVGSHCKIAGEINNSILFGYSSKSHDGFLGNSVIGEWCNLGAGTNNSNLKNNYAKVKLWNYSSGRFDSTDLQFCGLIMGDHSKSGINTMFNTGTVIGVGVNIYGTGFPRNFIPSFSWGGNSGFVDYNISKMCSVAEIVMKRRNVDLTQSDIDILKKLFDLTSKYRNY